MGLWDATQPVAGSVANSAFFRSMWGNIQDSLAEAVNLIEDPTFQWWPGGAATDPWGWAHSGAGAAVAQETGGANLNGLGPYAVKLTYGSATAVFGHSIQAAANFLTYFRGKTFVAAMAVKASSPSQARLEINDGVGSSYSNYHSGGGGYEWLTVARTLDPAANSITLNLRCEGAGSIWAQGVSAGFGEIPPGLLVPRRHVFDGREVLRNPMAILEDRLSFGSLPIILDSQFANVAGNVGSSETPLFQYPLPANVLDVNGKGIAIDFWGSLNTNANSKQIRAYFGGTSWLMYNATGSGLYFRGRLEVRRSGAASQVAFGDGIVGASLVTPGVITPAETLASSIVVKVTAQGVASNDIVAYLMQTTLLRQGGAQG